MSDQTSTAPQASTAPKAQRARREKSSLDIIKEIDDLALQIHDLNELTFVRNRLNQRIEKLASASGPNEPKGSQE